MLPFANYARRGGRSKHATLPPLRPSLTVGIPRENLKKLHWWQHPQRSKLFTYRIKLGQGHLSCFIDVDEIAPIGGEECVAMPGNVWLDFGS